MYINIGLVDQSTFGSMDTSFFILLKMNYVIHSNSSNQIDIISLCIHGKKYSKDTLIFQFKIICIHLDLPDCPVYHE
jgi:hypothetical protein